MAVEAVGGLGSVRQWRVSVPPISGWVCRYGILAQAVGDGSATAHNSQLTVNVRQENGASQCGGTALALGG
jgi:hypothetical protein